MIKRSTYKICYITLFNVYKTEDSGIWYCCCVSSDISHFYSCFKLISAFSSCTTVWWRSQGYNPGRSLYHPYEWIFTKVN